MSGKTNEELKEKKRPGRKPMTPEQKAAAKAAREAEKAKADFRAKIKRTLITDLKLYIKPVEHAAYYVVNGKHEGKISF